MIEATQLLPRLFIGSKPPVGRELADEGLDTLVLCAMEYQPRSVQFPGLDAVIHAPLDDAELTSHEGDTALMAAMEAADRYQRGETVLITCMQGRNRSGLVAALTIAMVTCIDAALAGQHVRAFRRGPDGGAALGNPSFVRFLSGMGRLC
jgi:sulfur relay (sulfurtransferase) DsrF/TusC family protein